MSSAVFYTSDLHLGHLRVARIRGYETAEDHDERLIKEWNNVVDREDIVWVLGDVCLSNKSLDKVRQLNGTKHLVSGNHDAVHPMHRTAHKEQDRWLGYFASVQPFARRKVDGFEFLLSHFPYEGDRGDQPPRYMQYRLRDEGMPLVHGHLHSSFATHEEMPRQVHVGWDAWQFPVSQTLVVAMLKLACDEPGLARELSGK